jgi:hypothetical protein
MNENHWLRHEEVEHMVYVPNLPPKRLRLFAVECCRRIIQLMVDRRSVAAIEAMGRHAAKGITDKAHASALNRADAAVEAQRLKESHPDAWTRPETRAARAAWHCTLPDEIPAAHGAAYWAASALLDDEKGELRRQAELLRCLCGNPFRAVSVDRAWLTGVVVSLALAAHMERIPLSGELDPQRLAVLSDALEEAGCDDADILSHLRSPGPHVRGCWVVDLLTGRS